MRLVQVALVICAIIFASRPAAAAPETVQNKEGFWSIGVDDGACVASMVLQGGAVFLLRGKDGKVSFGLFGARPLPKGKAGRIDTEAGGVDFKPSYSDDAATLFYDGEFDVRALAVLRPARQARVLVDGKSVATMTLEGTGFEGVLDGVVACSNGEKGWWGEGVVTSVANAEGPPLNKEGFWSLQASEDSCSSVLRIEGGFGFVLIVTNRGQDFMVGAGSDAGFKNGRKATLEAGAFSLPFKPDFADKRTYVQLDKFMDRQAATRLRDATSLAIHIDGEEAISAEVGETGMRQLVDDLAACGRGQKGWWGEGARPR